MMMPMLLAPMPAPLLADLSGDAAPSSGLANGHSTPVFSAIYAGESTTPLSAQEAEPPEASAPEPDEEDAALVPNALPKAAELLALLDAAPTRAPFEAKPTERDTGEAASTPPLVVALSAPTHPIIVHPPSVRGPAPPVKPSPSPEVAAPTADAPKFMADLPKAPPLEPKPQPANSHGRILSEPVTAQRGFPTGIVLPTKDIGAQPKPVDIAPLAPAQPTPVIGHSVAPPAPAAISTPALAPPAPPIAAQFASALPRLRKDGGTYELALTPATLGSVRVSWDAASGGVQTLRIVAAEPATTQLLTGMRDSILMLVQQEAAGAADRPAEFRVDIAMDSRSAAADRRGGGEAPAQHGASLGMHSHAGTPQEHRRTARPQYTGSDAVNAVNDAGDGSSDAAAARSTPQATLRLA